MEKLDYVKNDKEIIDIYNQISDNEDGDKFWAHHNFEHVNNVANMVNKILKLLNYDDEFIEEAMISAILHDVGSISGKENHAYRSYEFAKDYLKRKNLNLKNEDLVLDAIKNHSDGFDTENIMALILIFSDKLDIKYTRVAKEGYKVEGMRQLQYIKDILINIENNILKIDFICDEKIDKEELENFYFTKKVFKAIVSFSKKLNLDYTVLLNNNLWNI